MHIGRITQLLTGTVMALAATAVLAEPQQCPADKAAERGYAAYESFHKVMAPAWHVAWPAKDFGALFKAGEEFTTHIKAVDAVVPQLKSKVRTEKFLAARKHFDGMVATFADACKKMDSTKVYELMPQVHEAFEASGGLLGPIEFPHLEGILVTIELIADKHIPEKNVEGLEASTTTLVSKAKSFDTTMIPEDLKEHSSHVTTLMSHINESCGKLAEFVASKDEASSAALCKDIRTEIHKFMEEWL